ncbi:uncharacterized protein LAESUDRAFT_727009 [Laetiporus sulphureus 93-53]|uniref:Uncharacterized protein n=1 Tax=Laetiporus sulphureus 93-53 TaxID=1314785 RepID=A0A165DQ07_9APHY|nr:uncharacterized protein LAESUDRAFT_727009 [Laetiporus sulphureus 93-53]KZT05372.1 hypothetical protein LAESUDRAFT_727009 [Laetiporus sulphureus 93-53]
MGSAASKPARHFSKSVKPKWAGTRTTNPSEATTSQSAMPQASEIRNEAIERDSVDPQFLANLSKLGQVRVDHHMQTIRPAADRAQRIIQSRMESEVEARSARPSRNHLLATSLLDLLHERQTATNSEQLQTLTDQYDIDLARLESVARFVNGSSVEEGSVKKVVDDDGVERITMKAAWKDPKLNEKTP